MALYLIITILLIVVFIFPSFGTGNIEGKEVVGVSFACMFFGVLIIFLWSMVYPWTFEDNITAYELQPIYSVKDGQPLGHAVLSDSDIGITYIKDGKSIMDTIPFSLTDIKTGISPAKLEIHKPHPARNTWISTQLICMDIKQWSYVIYIPEQEIKFSNFEF